MERARKRSTRLGLTVILAAAFIACLVSIPPVWAIPNDRVTAPDRPDRPGELTVARLEASVYSLPYMEAQAKPGMKNEEVLLSPVIRPVLRFPWKVADHSEGLNVNSILTVKLFRDEAFPLGEETRWVEVETLTKKVANRGSGPRSRFERQGCLEIRSDLSYRNPVRRYKMVLKASVSTALHSESATGEAVFYVTLPPMWKGVLHQHETLVKMLLLAHRRKQALLRWRAYIAAATLANRSLRDAKRFGRDQVVSILNESQKLAARAPGDEELEEIVYDVMSESGKVMGRLAERLSAVNRKILGVTRIGFSCAEVMKKLSERTNERLAGIISYRNLLVGFLNVVERADIDQGIDRIVYFANEESRALKFLWKLDSSGDIAVYLGRLKKALALESKEITSLARRLGRLLGKNRRGGWSALFESRLYKELYPEGALDNKDAVCGTIRSIFQCLYYLLLTQRYHARVLEAAAARSLESFDVDAPSVTTVAPIDDRQLPERLYVSAPLTGQSISPGDIAAYRITVRNLGYQPREVRLREIRKPPSGWISRFTAESVLLQPGEQRTITYSVTAPYYTARTMTARSSVRIFFAEDPGRFHEPVFETRCAVGPETDVTPDTGPAHLLVKAPDSAREIRPGAVATYEFILTHQGGGRKLVNFDVVSEIPENWIVEAEPRRMYLQPGLPRRATVKVTAPLYIKKPQKIEIVVGAGYADDFDSLERIRLQTLVTKLQVVRSQPVINRDRTRTYYVPLDRESTFDVSLRNIGNADDTFDIFLNPPPRGWYVHMPRTTVRLEGGGKAVELPFTVRPALDAAAGSYVKIGMTAVSVTHPEIRADADLVLSVVEDRRLELVPVARLVRVAPGDAVDVSLNAKNSSKLPMTVGFRTSIYCERPTWLKLRQPPALLAPGESRLVSGRLRVPDNEKIGQNIPFSVSAVNERGDEIGAVRFDLAVCRRHAVSIVLDEKGITRSAGLVTARLVVTNQGTVNDDVSLLIRGGIRRWRAKLSSTRLSLAPGQTGYSRLIVRIPPRASERKTVNVKIQAKSATDSSASDFVTVEVKP